MWPSVNLDSTGWSFFQVIYAFLDALYNPTHATNTLSLKNYRMSNFHYLHRIVKRFIIYASLLKWKKCLLRLSDQFSYCSTGWCIFQSILRTTKQFQREHTVLFFFFFLNSFIMSSLPFFFLPKDLSFTLYNCNGQSGLLRLSNGTWPSVNITAFLVMSSFLEGTWLQYIGEQRLKRGKVGMGKLSGRTCGTKDGPSVHMAPLVVIVGLSVGFLGTSRRDTRSRHLPCICPRLLSVSTYPPLIDPSSMVSELQKRVSRQRIKRCTLIEIKEKAFFGLCISV
ncbi:hypothetical protein HNY73_014612 [Argiope bruennichi]|uniref:Uncharacterized protein n=1 Tax=Argiope bruennichi TaxID=94029 RepID=A0A8T0EPU2_ARGBR|nr:hypothetical protein HNY73_014612 [Argiope bruennichi]